MSPEKYETTMSVSKSLVLFLSLIVYISPVFADEPDELYQLALSNAKSVQSASIPRLSDVLGWKDSAPDRLSHRPVTDDANARKLASLAATQQTKRVFCNGFTGCGGRFRGRRRLPTPTGFGQQHIVSKRPFCNTYGCYNSGRKRSIEEPTENSLEISQTPDQKLITLADEWPWTRIKKLFCNGYGGCQNMGKRLQLAPGSSESLTGEHPLSLPFSKDSLHLDGGKKRFFTSGYDDDMDSLIDSMRR